MRGVPLVAFYNDLGKGNEVLAAKAAEKEAGEAQERAALVLKTGGAWVGERDREGVCVYGKRSLVVVSGTFHSHFFNLRY